MYAAWYFQRKSIWNETHDICEALSFDQQSNKYNLNMFKAGK